MDLSTFIKPLIYDLQESERSRRDPKGSPDVAYGSYADVQLAKALGIKRSFYVVDRVDPETRRINRMVIELYFDHVDGVYQHKRKNISVPEKEMEEFIISEHHITEEMKSRGWYEREHGQYNHENE